jgi:hypothetical protein
VNIQIGGLLRLDEIQLETGNTVLLTAQADRRENGLYSVSGGTWARLEGYGLHDGQAFDYQYIAVLKGTDAGKLYTIKNDLYVITITEIEFFETAFSPAKLPGKIVIRDRLGNFICGNEAEGGDNGGNGGGGDGGSGNGGITTVLGTHNKKIIVVVNGKCFAVR